MCKGRRKKEDRRGECFHTVAPNNALEFDHLNETVDLLESFSHLEGRMGKFLLGMVTKT